MHYVRPLDWREGGGKKRKIKLLWQGRRELTAPEKRWRFPWFRRQIQKKKYSANNARSLYDVFGKSKVPDKEMSPNFFFVFPISYFFYFFYFYEHMVSRFFAHGSRCVIHPARADFPHFVPCIHTTCYIPKGKKKKKGGK